MLKPFSRGIVLLAVVSGVTIAAQQPARPAATRAPRPAPPAPAPGTAGSYRSGDDPIAVLQKSIASTAPEMATSAVANTDQYRVNLVHREKAAGAIAHPGNTELHYVVEGSGTIVTGGTIVRPAAGSGGTATIENGETRQMKKGDIIIIPANTPHWYKEVDGAITYLEVRFVAPK
jgi:mannose-6-phosphate isomerase-like protein (cupin superfamily)